MSIRLRVSNRVEAIPPPPESGGALGGPGIRQKHERRGARPPRGRARHSGMRAARTQNAAQASAILLSLAESGRHSAENTAPPGRLTHSLFVKGTSERQQPVEHALHTTHAGHEEKGSRNNIHRIMTTLGMEFQESRGAARHPANYISVPENGELHAATKDVWPWAPCNHEDNRMILASVYLEEPFGKSPVQEPSGLRPLKFSERCLGIDEFLGNAWEFLKDSGHAG